MTDDPNSTHEQSPSPIMEDVLDELEQEVFELQVIPLKLSKEKQTQYYR